MVKQNELSEEKETFGELEKDTKHIKSGFDALDIASNMHGETQTVSRDIIISRTELPLENWGRNQVLFTKDMEDLLDGHLKKAKDIKDETSYKKIRILQKELRLRYLGEMQLLYAHTRSRGGVTHDALIKTTAHLEQDITNIKEQLAKTQQVTPDENTTE